MDQDTPPPPRSDDNFVNPAYVTSPGDVGSQHDRSFASIPGDVSSARPPSSGMQHTDTERAENHELSIIPRSTYRHDNSVDDLGPEQPLHPAEFSTPQFQGGRDTPHDHLNTSSDQLDIKDSRLLERDSENRPSDGLGLSDPSEQMSGSDGYHPENRVPGHRVPHPSEVVPRHGGDYPPQGYEEVIHGPPSSRQNPRKEASVDDSFDSVLLEDNDPGAYPQHPAAVGRLKGLENEAYAYDGDAETDLSHSFQGSPAEPPVLRNPDPFPVLERPLSGRYQKNPTLERAKPPVAQGPYDPHIGVFLAPPLATTKSTSGQTESRGVRRRIPRPPSKVTMKCAFFWSCVACLIGSFVCAIPALRYAVTASESRKIGDVNSANSYLKKTAILAAVALVLGVGAWTVVILHLSGSL